MTASRDRTVLAGLVGGIATASGVALTATSGWLIVRASEQPVLLTLMVAIVGVRAFGIARPFFRYVERLISHDAALADLADRRTRVYTDLIPLTPARLGRRSRSRVLTAVVDDVTDVVDAAVRVRVPVISSILAGAIAAGLSAWFDLRTGLILVALLLTVAGASWLAWRLESRALDAVLRARAEVWRVSELVARQAGELQAIGAEQTALDWLDEAHATAARAVRSQSRGRALVSAVILLATAAATAATALLVPVDRLGGPVAAMLIVIPVALGDALAPLVDAMRALARAQGSERRLHTLLDQEPAVTDPAAPDPHTVPDRPTLALDGVTASWTGAREDLAPLSLTIDPGRRVAIVGSNGSGKSTTLAVIARHLDPATGRYAVSGTDVADLSVAEVRGAIAMVDDEPHVFATRLRENLALASPGATDEELFDALTRAGLGEWLAQLDGGLDTHLGEGGRGVSGGERARLSVARALASRRPVLLLDEPVAHLDHATAVSVIDDVLAASAEQSVVMVSHRPEGLDRFDEIRDLTPAAHLREES